MPRYHHWHHSSQKAAIDRNFAIHFPWIDKLFGTHHHHAVGVEHRPWIAQEVSPVGIQALQALEASLDPKHILNPGKLLPDSDTAHSAAHAFGN